MTTIASFNDAVAARTRAAAQILLTPELRARYEAHGGLVEDLEHVRDAGLRAETLNQAQTEAQAAGKGATLTVLERFGALQREYKAIMAVVQATRFDLVQAKAPRDLVAAVDQILKDETQVHIRVIPSADETAQTRRARAAQSQEAVRAEIHKDAAGLLALTAVHAALAKRQVDAARLGRLQADAAALASHLAERTQRKGLAKAATQGERDAVAEQIARWTAIRRILDAIGQTDPAVASLLRDTITKRRAPAK
jgi:hypothetical protein